MSKVLCALCIYESKKRCVRKNNKVKLNKKRTCAMYKEDDIKLEAMAKKEENKKHIKTITRPDWYWNRKEEIRKVRNEARAKAASGQMPVSGDPKHPLTGDLSRFTTTVEDKDG